MQRYFAQKNNNQILLNSDDQHHLLNVLRARSGEQIEVVADKKVYLAQIISLQPLKIEIVDSLTDESEIKVPIVLYYCLSKGDKNEFVIQKATELGASKIVLVSSKRCVVKFEEKSVSKKIDRYSKIAKEAAEQCHRLVIPSIEGPFDISKLDKIINEKYLFVAYEGNKNDHAFIVEKSMDSIGILIGPEGGLEESEINLLNQFGFKNISLGKRILRTETAAVYALSVIANELEK